MLLVPHPHLLPACSMTCFYQHLHLFVQALLWLCSPLCPAQRPPLCPAGWKDQRINAAQAQPSVSRSPQLPPPSRGTTLRCRFFVGSQRSPVGLTPVSRGGSWLNDTPYCLPSLPHLTSSLPCWGSWDFLPNNLAFESLSQVLLLGEPKGR